MSATEEPSRDGEHDGGHGPSGPPVVGNPMGGSPAPGGTRCSEVLAEVWMFLDRECDETRRAVLEQHLDECEPCLSEYGLDEKLKALLARKCGGELAPDGLKDRLRKQIRSVVLEQASVSVESGPDGTTVAVTRSRVERHGY